MIKLTKRNGGDPIYLSPDHIISILGTDQAIAFTVEDSYQVTESPSTVARLITEYKQRQMRLQAAYIGYYSNFDAREFIKDLESEDRP
ncbi:flagellar FlbD family protein [Paenibacillus kobensis]|uniref:flagellar FlbD family protein n=1 Tax=Paenibacillus kobensis TaxID=59841 RepID=UPI000FD8C174|nr:flagellar FlbD family protein [Paenibacillus kobensis]